MVLAGLLCETVRQNHEMVTGCPQTALTWENITQFFIKWCLHIETELQKSISSCDPWKANSQHRRSGVEVIPEPDSIQSNF